MRNAYFQMVNGEQLVADLPDQPPEPLDAQGALAALLVVQGVLPIEDAANAIGVTPEQLVTEAQGWAAAAGGD